MKKEGERGRRKEKDGEGATRREKEGEGGRRREKEGEGGRRRRREGLTHTLAETQLPTNLRSQLLWDLHQSLNKLRLLHEKVSEMNAAYVTTEGKIIGHLEKRSERINTQEVRRREEGEVRERKEYGGGRREKGGGRREEGEGREEEECSDLCHHRS
jgi:hypothetical protein